MIIEDVEKAIATKYINKMAQVMKETPCIPHSTINSLADASKRFQNQMSQFLYIDCDYADLNSHILSAYIRGLSYSSNIALIAFIGADTPVDSLYKMERISSRCCAFTAVSIPKMKDRIRFIVGIISKQYDSIYNTDTMIRMLNQRTST